MPTIVANPDLPEVLQQDVQTGRPRRIVQSNDIAALIKRYVSSPDLAQKPLLTMTQERSNLLREIVPEGKAPLRERAQGPGPAADRERSDWRKLAEGVIKVYGESYRRAADYLTALCQDRFWRQAELTPLPYHSNPAGWAAPAGFFFAIT